MRAVFLEIGVAIMKRKTTNLAYLLRAKTISMSLLIIASCPMITVTWADSATQNTLDREMAEKYEYAIGVKRNLSVAATYYKRAAERGDPASAEKLSSMYRYGLGGLPQSDKLADKWLNLSAKDVSRNQVSAQPVTKVITYTDGDRYEGDIVYGKFNGKGTYTAANGSQYVGDFVDGIKHGKGTLTWNTGVRCEGDFVANKVTKGICTWPDGRRYEGDFVDGKISNGTLTTADGAVSKYVNGVKDIERSTSTAQNESDSSSGSLFGAILTGVVQGMAQRNAQRGVSMPSPSISSSPSAPSSYTPSQNSSVQNNENGKVGEDATYCIQHLGKGFKNNCGFDVNYFACVTEQPPDTVATPCDDVRWPLNKMHDQPITAYTSNSNINAYNGKHVFWVACKAPARTQNKSFTNNKLTAMCVQR